MDDLERKNKFIKKGQELFNNKFSYYKVIPFRSSEDDLITIICPIHGDFKTTPKAHLRSKYGNCPICSKLRGEIEKEELEKIEFKLPENFEYISTPIITSKDKIIGSIYMFINTINNKMYIGQTVRDNYKNRFYEHKRNAQQNVQNYFYNAIRKYGYDSFKTFILFQTEELNNSEENKKLLTDILNIKEKFYIALYKSNNPTFGYNLTEGGDGVSGYTFSKEAKQKMSNSKMGANHWNYGNTNGTNSEAVLQFDLDFNFIKEYPSAAEVERQLGYKSSNISRCCSNNIKTYKNYIWVRKRDYYEGYLQEHKSNCKHSACEKPVLQFDFLGNLISRYNNCVEAQIALHKN